MNLQQFFQFNELATRLLHFFKLNQQYFLQCALRFAIPQKCFFFNLVNFTNLNTYLHINRFSKEVSYPKGAFILITIIL